MAGSYKFHEVTRLFHEIVMQGDTAAREDLLAAAAPEVREEVEALLASSVEEAKASAQARRDLADRRFGPWQTTALLGQGGMGAVYLAHRADGAYDGQAAVKTVHPVLAGAGFEERFLTERQILASLQHPNITRLLDGGVTADGAPYLAMEYVEGTHLDAYCRTSTLPLADRVRLFLEICDAVSYAHRKLVVHRDLKPSNILVDSAGHAHLLDFGTARLLDRKAAEAITQLNPLTPAWASPEQLRGEAATPASDQYALGKLLREIAGPEMPADIHAIAEHATAADPERRYRSVDELADDARAWLASRPIRARSRGKFYRAALFIRRNRASTALAGLTAVAVLTGAVLTVRARAVAERRFDEVHSLARWVVLDLDDQIADLPGSTAARVAMAERSTRYLDSLAAQAGNDASLKLDLAAGYLKLANVYGNLHASNVGKLDLAREAYRKGLQIVGQLSGTPEGRLMEARLNFDRAMMESTAQANPEAEAAAERAITTFREFSASAPNDAAKHFQLGRALIQLGIMQQQKGGLVLSSDKTEGLAAEAETHLRRSAELAPENVEYRFTLADLSERRAITRGSIAPAEALRFHDEAQSAFDQLPESVRRSWPKLRWQSKVWINRGWALGQLKRFDEALALLSKADPLVAQLVAADPANQRVRLDRTALLRTTGIICNYAGRKEDAIRQFESAVAVYDGFPQQSDILRFLRAELLMRIASLNEELRRPDEAAKWASNALDAIRPLADRPSAQAPHLMAMAQLLSGDVASRVRRPAEAIGYAERAAKLQPRDVSILEVLAAAYRNAGRNEEAVATLRRALDATPAALPGQPVGRGRQGIEAKLKAWQGARI